MAASDDGLLIDVRRTASMRLPTAALRASSRGLDSMRHRADWRTNLIAFSGLHGEADSAQGRVLTGGEYTACYGDGGIYRELLKLLIANTSLLFLGCSLSVDRTVLALREIKQAAIVETPRHYAFFAAERRYGP